MNHFKAALSRTMAHEDGYGFDAKDPGGETYCGISRRYWPGWSGWHIIDRHRTDSDLNDIDFRRSGINELVESFYEVNFWTRFQGDKLAEISPNIAYEVFDTAVNLDVSDAVRFLQTSLNMQLEYNGAYSLLTTDGLLGPLTINALRLYLNTQPGNHENNEKILLACLNGEQYLHYKANPRHKYFRGWFLRT